MTKMDFISSEAKRIIVNSTFKNVFFRVGEDNSWAVVANYGSVEHGDTVTVKEQRDKLVIEESEPKESKKVSPFGKSLQISGCHNIVIQNNVVISGNRSSDDEPIIVTLQKDVPYDVVVNNSFGDLKIEGLTFSRFVALLRHGSMCLADTVLETGNIELKMGDSQLSQCHSRDLSIKCSHGEIKLFDSVITKLRVEQKFGSTTLKGVDGQDMFCDTIHGDISAALKGSRQEYRVDVHSVHGKCHVEGKTDDRPKEKRLLAYNKMGDVNVTFEKLGRSR